MERGERTLQILTGFRSYGKMLNKSGSPLQGKFFPYLNDVNNGNGLLFWVDKPNFNIVHQAGVMELQADWMEEKFGKDDSLKYIKDIKKEDDRVETITCECSTIYIGI